MTAPLVCSARAARKKSAGALGEGGSEEERALGERARRISRGSVTGAA